MAVSKPSPNNNGAAAASVVPAAPWRSPTDGDPPASATAALCTLVRKSSGAFAACPLLAAPSKTPPSGIDPWVRRSVMASWLCLPDVSGDWGSEDAKSSMSLADEDGILTGGGAEIESELRPSLWLAARLLGKEPRANS